jgi:hypothetical protein
MLLELLVKMNSSLGGPFAKFIKPLTPKLWLSLHQRAEVIRSNRRLEVGKRLFLREESLESLTELFASQSDLKRDALSASILQNSRKLISENQVVIVTDDLERVSNTLKEKKFHAITDIQALSAFMESRDLEEFVFVPSFNTDSEALPFLFVLYSRGARVVPPIHAEKNSYRFVNHRSLSALSATWKDVHKISHWSLKTHENLTEAIEITKKLTGCVVEIGVYRGGTALTILNYLAHLEDEKKREVFLLDTFEGFSEAEGGNPDPIWRDTHKLLNKESNMQHVSEVLMNANYPFELICCDIIENKVPEQITEVSLAHIDVDSYLATKMALIKISPFIQTEGIILLEDPPGTPLLYGAFVAMEEFLNSTEGQKYLKIYKEHHYLLLKLKH